MNYKQECRDLKAWLISFTAPSKISNFSKDKVKLNEQKSKIICKQELFLNKELPLHQTKTEKLNFW